MTKIDMIAGKSDCNDKSKWLSFKTHSIDTAGIMDKLYREWLPKSVRKYIFKSLNFSYDIKESEYRTGDFCRLIALLHDIGKLTPAFQCKIEKSIENYSDILMDMGLNVSGITEYKSSPHNIASQVILDELGFPKEISIIVGSHHGRTPQNCRNQLSIYKSNYFGRNSKQEHEWRNLWAEWTESALKETGWSLKELPKPDVKLQMILTGLLIMSDWIASNTKYFPYVEVGRTVSDDEYVNRLEYAWKKLGLPETTWEAKQIYNLHEFFEERFSYKPNTVQQTVMDIVSENTTEGIYILEAPMGIGKTEAALSAVEILASKFGAGGIYFGLPTQATANGIFGRIRKWAEKCDTKNHTIRLAHGATDLNEEYQELFHGTASESVDDGVIVHEWFEGRKQALLSDFVIATVDQLLLASLKQRHVMLRHLGLAGKVVVIDECHAYDAYMNVYLDHTLTWLGAYKVPVIILSATLPKERRNDLIKAYLKNKKFVIPANESDNFSYPVITWTSGTEVMQKAVESGIANKRVCLSEIDESQIISVLSEKMADGGCVAVIVNTVAGAQSISKKISAEMSGFEVICFHSRFTSSDRALIEKKLLEITGRDSLQQERNRLIVVGTQVLEQSLDVDFDFMITELCPMDLLLQRSGRLHRHSDRIRPERLKNAQLVIFPATENGAKIYSKWILDRTKKYLPEKLVIPECIPYLVNKVYSNPENDEELNSYEWREFERIVSDKKSKAKKYCIKSNMLNKSYKNSLADFLDDCAGNDTDAEASVRDTDETIEVIIMRRVAENRLETISGNKNVSFDTTFSLSDEEARLIAIQRLRLPQYFSKYNFNKTFGELDVMPKSWRDNKWLKGELLLILDKNSETELAGKKLYYSSERGLEMIEQG